MRAGAALHGVPHTGSSYCGSRCSAKRLWLLRVHTRDLRLVEICRRETGNLRAIDSRFRTWTDCVQTCLMSMFFFPLHVLSRFRQRIIPSSLCINTARRIPAPWTKVDSRNRWCARHRLLGGSKVWSRLSKSVYDSVPQDSDHPLLP